MAQAEPAAPFTEGGGVAWPEVSRPQHTTAPVPAWIAQLWPLPTAIAEAVPPLPFTEAGGVDNPKYVQA